jgi:hypothetical protein
MTDIPSKEQLAGLREFFTKRQSEFLSSVRALVETESPSGDANGSREVVAMLAESAKAIPAVNSGRTNSGRGLWRASSYSRLWRGRH